MDSFGFAELFEANLYCMYMCVTSIVFFNQNILFCSI